ncbi:uncharacterized protein [Prorops nasuta]
MGGVLALDGKTGKTIWTHWAAHAIFSIDCGLDITDDKVNDCIISGRGGILHSINGKDGSSIWEYPVQDLPRSNMQRIFDVYDAKFIADINADGFGDVIASRATQSNGIHSSEILLISGKDGTTLQSVNLPNTEQLFTVPQILVHPDGENIFVLATSSQEKSGGLYIIPQSAIMHGEMKLKKLPHSAGKGIFLPPILADITSDGTEDIISALFNSTIIAYNGLTFESIWNYTVPNSEIISIPIPGYYNDDNIPDFMVKHQIGSGFPTYFYTVATILDGKTGKPLLERPIEDSLSTQMSGLSITVDGFGNDWFLHWSANCLKYEGNKDEYQFLKGENLISQTRADLCKLRFNSSLATKFLALSQHVGPPGLLLYYSEDWKALEYNNSVNPRKEAEEKYMDVYANSDSISSLYGNKPFVSERPSKVLKNSHKEIFRQTGDNEFSGVKSLDKIDNDDVNIGYKEDAWNNENKWIGENKRPEKDYGLFYDANDNNNIDDAGMDYVDPNEIREQRSSIYNDNNSDFLQVNLINKSVGDVNDTINQTYISKTAVNNRINTANPNNQMHVDLQDLNGPLNVDKNKAVIKINGREPKNYIDVNNGNDKNNNNGKVFIKKSVKTEKKHVNKEGLEPKLKMNFIHDDKIKLRKKRIKRKLNIEGDWGGRIDGLPRQSPTGILLPPLKQSADKNAIDLVFTTFWLPPSEISIILTKEDLDCIRKKTAQLKIQNENEDDEDIVKECLMERGINYDLYQETMDRENVNIALGQMTIYRMRLECVCPEDMLPNQSCKNISPVQSWPEHLGASGNGFFRPMQKD